MKNSNISPTSSFSAFLTNMNASVYGAQSVKSNSTRSGHVSFSHIKAIDRKIAACIKNKEYISADDKEQLNKLRDVIENQVSRCTSKKLTKFNEALKNLSAIKSESCKAWDSVIDKKNHCQALNKQRAEVQQQRDSRFQIFSKKMNEIPESNIPENAKQEFADCIAAATPQQMYAKFNHFIQSCGENIKIDRTPEHHSLSESASIQKAIETLPAASLSWGLLKNEINEIRKLDLELSNLEKSILQEEDCIHTTLDKFYVTKDQAGIDKLKKMNTKPAVSEKSTQREIMRGEWIMKPSSRTEFNHTLFALRVQSNAERLINSPSSSLEEEAKTPVKSLNFAPEVSVIKFDAESAPDTIKTASREVAPLSEPVTEIDNNMPG